MGAKCGETFVQFVEELKKNPKLKTKEFVGGDRSKSSCFWAAGRYVARKFVLCKKVDKGYHCQAYNRYVAGNSVPCKEVEKEK
jgi:hypothetical protein